MTSERKQFGNLDTLNKIGRSSRICVINEDVHCLFDLDWAQICRDHATGTF